ncbi:hypothetical protein X744_31290 [Mesorhizobium sp. LNJC372A00]|nr:hypothetical protein X745_31635 [Mesorhizobium sp. LNJC374B00]ESY51453.1 hypothetical protein X744_31290 [Mesorhizobium sp. LNJC372A00]
MDGIGLSSAIKSKQVSCVEVMTAYLDRIYAFNPRVNAIISMPPRETLLAEARERDAQLARGHILDPLEADAGALAGTIERTRERQRLELAVTGHRIGADLLAGNETLRHPRHFRRRADGVEFFR